MNFNFFGRAVDVAVKTISNKVVRISLADENGEETYDRLYKNANGLFFAVLNGKKIEFNSQDCVVSIVKIYDTKELKRKSTESLSNGNSGEQKAAKAEQPAKPALEKVDYESGEIKHEKYNAIKTCLECNIPVYLAGPAGSGKNYTVEQIAKELGWNFYFSNSVQQEYKLTGFIDAGGRYHETEFYKACTDSKDCVFFLDEMDASIPEVLVLLNAAIANGYFEFPNGRIDLAKVHFVAAGNTSGNGADETYTGRMVIDGATMDRFAIIEFGYDERVELSLSKGNKELVEFVHDLRESARAKGIKAVFSYRAIIMVTKLLNAAMKPSEVFAITLFKGMDKDTMGMLVNGCKDTVNSYYCIAKKVAA